jgi:peptidoglycan/xylan/chitin deacetylase (PgdA/CDA1 family)
MLRMAHVLTYHSGNIEGNSYATNNIVAFREDLEVIRSLGLPIVPLRTVVDTLLGDGSRDLLPDHVVCLTLDDGLDFDFQELTHPNQGPQESIRGIMQDFKHSYSEPVHATSFVIASAAAREQIANKEMLGHQWISEWWWRPALETGLFHIGSHSWDHISPSTDFDVSETGRRGSSRFIDDSRAADLQVRAARAYIEGRASNPGSALLAYPYGDYSSFLVDEYLPDPAKQHGVLAAFTVNPGVIVPDSNRWVLPRNTCGIDWTSPEELRLLLSA